MENKKIAYFCMTHVKQKEMRTSLARVLNFFVGLFLIKRSCFFPKGRMLELKQVAMLGSVSLFTSANLQ